MTKSNTICKYRFPWPILDNTIPFTTIKKRNKWRHCQRRLHFKLLVFLVFQVIRVIRFWISLEKWISYSSYSSYSFLNFSRKVNKKREKKIAKLNYAKSKNNFDYIKKKKQWEFFQQLDFTLEQYLTAIKSIIYCKQKYLQK